jgi:hypothetical protein
MGIMGCVGDGTFSRRDMYTARSLPSRVHLLSKDCISEKAVYCCRRVERWMQSMCQAEFQAASMFRGVLGLIGNFM